MAYSFHMAYIHSASICVGGIAGGAQQEGCCRDACGPHGCVRDPHGQGVLPVMLNLSLVKQMPLTIIMAARCFQLSSLHPLLPWLCTALMAATSSFCPAPCMHACTPQAYAASQSVTADLRLEMGWRCSTGPGHGGTQSHHSGWHQNGLTAGEGASQGE